MSSAVVLNDALRVKLSACLYIAVLSKVRSVDNTELCSSVSPVLPARCGLVSPTDRKHRKLCCQ